MCRVFKGLKDLYTVHPIACKNQAFLGSSLEVLATAWHAMQLYYPFARLFLSQLALPLARGQFIVVLIV